MLEVVELGDTEKLEEDHYYLSWVSRMFSNQSWIWVSIWQRNKLFNRRKGMVFLEVGFQFHCYFFLLMTPATFALLVAFWRNSTTKVFSCFPFLFTIKGNALLHLSHEYYYYF